MNKQSTSSYALITGASSGIGMELAKHFAMHGINLIITARSTDKLNHLATDLRKQYNIQVFCFTADLTKSNEVKALYDFTNEKSIFIDYLINNAGFGSMGKFNEDEWNNELDMMNLNITALTHLTKLYLKDMVNEGRGKIMNVASTAAFQPGPLMSVYYASKAFVLSFTEGIAEELKGTGITVTALCPGPTNSNFQKRAGIENSRLFNSMSVSSSAFIAKFGYNAMQKGKVVAIPGFMNKIGAFTPRISPRNLVRKVVKYLHLSVRK